MTTASTLARFPPIPIGTDELPLPGSLNTPARVAYRVVLAFGRTTEDVDFGALDGLPVRLVFLIGAPKAQEPSRIYLNLMARLSFLMKDEGNRRLLLGTDSVKEVLGLLDSVG